ncbi:MAG: hypothetical protein JO215_06610 [Ktedonobacteraceae bacterium]|nr:hypothetical protein [Ktedonobacteraceae bacterium]MBV9710952.1 hypothetical protein [Ktedonobacteraceae bacterium]
MATLLIDRNDNIGTMREFRDGIKFIAKAKERYPRNALIQDMVEGGDKSIQEVQAYTVGERQEAVWAYQRRIDEVVGLLANDEEAREFKVVLVELAKAVAGAAGFGIFGTGEKVSIAEATFIDALKRRLGVG